MEILDEKVNAHLPLALQAGLLFFSGGTTTEEEQSSLKRLEETIPELFQCAVVRQMGIDLFIYSDVQEYKYTWKCTHTTWVCLLSLYKRPKVIQ